MSADRYKNEKTNTENNYCEKERCLIIYIYKSSSGGKEHSCTFRRHKRHWLTPGLGRSPGGEHGNSHQYSCLENPMDRGAGKAAVHRVLKSRI